MAQGSSAGMAEGGTLPQQFLRDPVDPHGHTARSVPPQQWRHHSVAHKEKRREEEEWEEVEHVTHSAQWPKNALTVVSPCSTPSMVGGNTPVFRVSSTLRKTKAQAERGTMKQLSKGGARKHHTLLETAGRPAGTSGAECGLEKGPCTKGPPCYQLRCTCLVQNWAHLATTCWIYSSAAFMSPRQWSKITSARPC